VSTGGPVAAPDDVLPAQRRWPRRLLIGVNIFVIVCLAVAAAGYAYLHFRLGQIRKVAVSGETTVDTGQPLTILVAGSDSRAGESAAAAAHFGSASLVAGQRSDVILLVHIDPRTNSASMLSIPRDTFVQLAGTPISHNKINVAFNSGPSQLVETINQNFGIQINHVIQVSFEGVMAIDDAVGGVCMNFPYPARDGSPTGTGNESGLDISTAGQHVLDGNQALALIRSRYYQYYENGQWVAEGTGDIGRIVRQHEFLRALASKALHQALSNPLTANALTGDAVHDVTVDQALSSGDILHLLAEMRHVHPESVPSWTLPTNSVTNYEGYGDVLMPEPTADQAVIHQWLTYDSQPPTPAPRGHKPKSHTATTLAPSSVTLTVHNGTGVQHQAATAAQALTGLGFTVASTGDAPSFDHVSSVVSYGPGGDKAARTVAGYVEGGATLQPDSTLPHGAVVLTTGTSFAGIGPPGSTPTTTTTTTPPSGVGSTGTNVVPPWDPVPCK
jgi:LCP family protein required for cell wall assembly